MALDMDLDLMGAQPALFGLYTQLAFIFPLPETKSHSTLVSTITNGLGRLSENFPWVSGQVINITTDSDRSPIYKIRPFESVPRLIVKQYEKDTKVPTFTQLTNAGFPMSMMGEGLWAPCPTLCTPGFDPSRASGNADNPAPVLMVQISIIMGGLVLCINMQHNVCDMMGQAAVMSWLSKACSGKDFTIEELKTGNMDRGGLVSLYEEEVLDPEVKLKHQLISLHPKSNNQRTPVPEVTTLASSLLPECSWIYFNFGKSSLERLKDLATRELPEGVPGYISTDDALSAFIFRSVLRARSPRLSGNPCVTFARAVDTRRYLHVPADYPGILQNMAYTSYRLSTLVSTPLGHIAAAMRQQVDPHNSDMARRTLSLIKFLSLSPDNASQISFTATLQSDTDVMMSSWSKVAAYDWSFGLGLGSAVAVRRPSFVPVESLMYIMPRTNNGAIAVAMCLRKEDFSQLNQDQEWNRYTERLG